MNRPLFVFALIFALLLAGVASVNGAEIALAIPLLAYLGSNGLARRKCALNAH
jgi:multisubunit Na+/H+ antiporter MnhF subunit